MDKYASPLNMTQEVVSQPHAHGGTFDQPRNICQDNGDILIDVRHTQVWFQGCERIGRDFGLGIRQHRKQRGFACVGDANEANIRDELQLQFDAPLFGRFTFFGGARHLIPGSGKVLVPAPAAPAFEYGQCLTRLSQVADQLTGVCVGNDGARWHIENQVLAVSPRPLCRPAFDAFFCLEFLIVMKGRERVERGFNLKYDISAFTAITAIRPAEWDKFFTTEVHHAVAAFSGFSMNFYLVCEHTLTQFLLSYGCVK